MVYSIAPGVLLGVDSSGSDVSVIIDNELISKLKQALHDLRSPLNSLTLVSHRMQRLIGNGKSDEVVGDQSWSAVIAATTELEKSVSDLANVCASLPDVYSDDRFATANNTEIATDKEVSVSAIAGDACAVLVTHDRSVFNEISHNLSAKGILTYRAEANQGIGLLKKLECSLLFVDMGLPSQLGGVLLEELALEYRLGRMPGDPVVPVVIADPKQKWDERISHILLSRDRLGDGTSVEVAVSDSIIATNALRKVDYLDKTDQLGLADPWLKPMSDQHILFVGNDITQFYSLASTLKYCGYHVHFAQSEYQMCLEIEREPLISFACVFVPDQIDSLCQQIKRMREEQPNLPIVALVNEVSCQRIQLLLLAGVTECLDCSDTVVAIWARIRVLAGQ
jgi:CheY-like chemotaxis protein